MEREKLRREGGTGGCSAISVVIGVDGRTRREGQTRNFPVGSGLQEENMEKQFCWDAPGRVIPADIAPGSRYPTAQTNGKVLLSAPSP